MRASKFPLRWFVYANSAWVFLIDVYIVWHGSRSSNMRNCVIGEGFGRMTESERFWCFGTRFWGFKGNLRCLNLKLVKTDEFALGFELILKLSKNLFEIWQKKLRLESKLERNVFNAELDHGTSFEYKPRRRICIELKIKNSQIAFMLSTNSTNCALFR